MTSYNFQDVPGKIGGATLPANPLINLEQLVPPQAGPHKDLLTKLGYPFVGYAGRPAAIRTTRLSRSIFGLQDSGMLAKHDTLILSTGALAGSMVNLVPNKLDTTAAQGIGSPVITSPGSGGTDGTFALAFTGGTGSAGAGTFTVAGGALTEVNITNAGIYSLAPALSFAASGGLTGAAATVQLVNNLEFVNANAQTDGMGSHIRTFGSAASYLRLMAANFQNYTLNECCAWIYLEEEPPAPAATNAIIGNVGVGDQSIRFNRNSGSPYIQLRVNAAASPSGLGFTNSMWGPGLWMVERSDANTVSVYKNGELMASSSASPATVLPTGIGIGRDATAANALKFSSAGIGGLIEDKRGHYALMNAHRNII